MIYKEKWKSKWRNNLHTRTVGRTCRVVVLYLKSLITEVMWCSDGCMTSEPMLCCSGLWSWAFKRYNSIIWSYRRRMVYTFKRAVSDGRDLIPASSRWSVSFCFLQYVYDKLTVRICFDGVITCLPWFWPDL